jgi:putative membrane protein
MDPAKQRASLSDYLAAERTLLAWIRTGLALMGFGFVVARFGLFLQEFQAMQHSRAIQPYGPSLWFGTALISVGVIVNIFAGWRHIRLIRGLDSGEIERSRPSVKPVAIAFFLALVGLAMAIYLIWFRHSTLTPTASSVPAIASQAIRHNSGQAREQALNPKHLVSATSLSLLDSMIQAQSSRPADQYRQIPNDVEQHSFHVTVPEIHFMHKRKHYQQVDYD